MIQSLNFVVKDNKKRIDVFLSNAMNLSRTKTTFLIMNGFVKINGQKIQKNNIILNQDDVIDVIYDDEVFIQKKDDMLAQKMDLDIVYEDDYIIVVNKAKNVITHPTAHDKEGTLANGLLYHINQGKQKQQNIFMVHRLDKDTTGLIVAAKDFESLARMQEQIQTRTMKRFYLAIVHNPFNEFMGTIDAPIGRTRDDSIKFTVMNAKNPKNAITKFYVLDQNEKHALIKCELLTGRTHQIRVHMAFIEHWILNDPLYGIRGEKSSDYKQFLHAYQIEFNHPKTNERIFLECNIDPTFQAKLDDFHLKIDKSIQNIETEMK